MSINLDSSKMIVLDTIRSSSVLNNVYQWNFPEMKLPTDGYLKVSSVYVRGTLPSSAYLQIVSQELGDDIQSICDGNTMDWTSTVIAIVPNRATYIETRPELRLYHGLHNNIITLCDTTAEQVAIITGFCVTLEFSPKLN